MIKNKTIIVLGAGASTDYGFPSGKQLLDDIINLLDGDVYENKFDKRTYFALLLQKHCEGNNAEGLLKYYDIIDNFYQKLINSSPASIDDFIHYVSEKNKDYEFLGKACIVCAITKYENENYFNINKSVTPKGHRYFNNESTESQNHLELRKGWYTYLWEKIYDGNIEDNLRNLTIVTYNYDRSLEHFLITRLINLCDYNKQDAADFIFTSLGSIFHVYGKIGKLGWEKEKDIKYENPYKSLNMHDVTDILKDSPERFEHKGVDNINYHLHGAGIDTIKRFKNHLDNVINLTKCIRTYTEAGREHGNLQFKIAEAQKLIFLGFGYHKQNLRWFDPKVFQIKKDIVIAGTGYKMGKTQLDKARKNIKDTFRIGSTHMRITINPFFIEDYYNFKIQEYLERVYDID